MVNQLPKYLLHSIIIFSYYFEVHLLNLHAYAYINVQIPNCNPLSLYTITCMSVFRADRLALDSHWCALPW